MTHHEVPGLLTSYRAMSGRRCYVDAVIEISRKSQHAFGITLLSHASGIGTYVNAVGGARKSKSSRDTAGLVASDDPWAVWEPEKMT